MANRETFMDLRLAPAGGDEKAPRESARLGLRFTERALYAWEVRGYEFPSRKEVAAGRTSKMKQLLWAGLEGYREYHGEKRVPWTLDLVNDLVERAGGWGSHFSKPLFEAYSLAFPEPDQGADAEGKAAASSPAPTGEQPSESRSATA